MSSTNSGGTNARHDVERYLKNNPGWHEVSALAASTGYSHGHTLSTGKALDDDATSPVEGRKNRNKPVVGYIINGTFQVPGDSRQEVIRLIKVHGNPPSNLSGKSLDDLFDYLRHNVATSVVTIDYKWEFRAP